MIQKTDEPIDAVYLWVDGQAPGFSAMLERVLSEEKAAPDALSIGRDRFRDNEELRYSLRSLGTYAPWIRTVYIVTNGRAPTWLNMQHARIRVVTHDQLFLNPENLPSFNSQAIELQLHRIPGLSRRFLYLNDDVFFGRTCAPSDFGVNDNAQRIYFQQTALPYDPDNGPVHDRAYAFTQNLMEEQWPRMTDRRLPAHTPQLYDKEVIAHLEGRFAEAFEQTSQHRFRTPRDLVLRILYFFYLLEKSPLRCNHEAFVFEDTGPDYLFVRLLEDDPSAIQSLVKIARFRPRFFCINDDLGNVDISHQYLCAVRSLLAMMFPERSSFELSPPTRTGSG